MAFNPDEYLKEPAAKPTTGFDPDAYLKETPTPASRPGQTALESFGNTATFGNLAQIQSGTQPVTDAIMDVASKTMRTRTPSQVDADLEAQGFKIQGPDTSYVAERDANIRRREGLEAENPGAALAGKAAGFAATIPLAGGGAPAATALGRAAQAAKGGAIVGALTNPGDVEGEVASPLQEIAARGKQAAKGAATSVAFQGGLDKLTGSLKGGAEKMAVKALNPTKSQVERLKVSDKENALGRMLLDEGAIPKGGSTNAILGRVSQKKDEIGQKIGDLLGKGGDKKLISGKVMAKNLEQADEFVQVAAGIPGAESLSKRAQGMLDTLKSRGQMTIQDAHALRKQVDKLINFSKRNDDLRGVEPQLHAIRNEINTAIQSVLNRFPGKQGDQLKRLNSAYSKLAEAERIAEGGVARQAANQTFSLGDKVMATVGGLSSGGLGAVVAGLGNKAARTYGRSAAARAMDFGSKASEKGALSPAIRAMVARLSSSPGGLKKSDDAAPLQDSGILGTVKKSKDRAPTGR